MTGCWLLGAREAEIERENSPLLEHSRDRSYTVFCHCLLPLSFATVFCHCLLASVVVVVVVAVANSTAVSIDQAIKGEGTIGSGIGGAPLSADEAVYVQSPRTNGTDCPPPPLFALAALFNPECVARVCVRPPMLFPHKPKA
jgi:hypothetical protein